jgi:uncharacterized damage-inducible protein DinB
MHQTNNDDLAGAPLALTGELRKAIDELIEVIRPLTPEALQTIVDPATDNPDCRSIQTVLAHVVHSGFGYTNYIEKHLGSDRQRPPKKLLDTADAYIQQLQAVADYCTDFFRQHPGIVMEENDNSKKILTGWGQLYDVEQLMEHAIVHVLRHRRQVEKFITMLHTY